MRREEDTKPLQCWLCLSSPTPQPPNTHAHTPAPHGGCFDLDRAAQCSAPLLSASRSHCIRNSPLGAAFLSSDLQQGKLVLAEMARPVIIVLAPSADKSASCRDHPDFPRTGCTPSSPLPPPQAQCLSQRRTSPPARVSWFNLIRNNTGVSWLFQNRLGPEKRGRGFPLFLVSCVKRFPTSSHRPACTTCQREAERHKGDRGSAAPLWAPRSPPTGPDRHHLHARRLHALLRPQTGLSGYAPRRHIWVFKHKVPSKHSSARTVGSWGENCSAPSSRSYVPSNGTDFHPGLWRETSGQCNPRTAPG